MMGSTSAPAVDMGGHHGAAIVATRRNSMRKGVAGAARLNPNANGWKDNLMPRLPMSPERIAKMVESRGRGRFNRVTKALWLAIAEQRAADVVALQARLAGMTARRVAARDKE